MNTRVLQTLHTGYADNAKTAILIPALGKQIRLLKSRVLNRTGGAIDLAIMRKFTAIEWSFFQWTDLTTTAVDKTSTIQTPAVTAITTLVNNDGFIVQSSKKFNLIGLTISTAPAGGVPAYVYEYWNGAAWTTLTTINTMGYATGDKLIVFAAPMNWAVGGSGAGLSASKYSIRVRASTAPSGTAGVATAAADVGEPMNYDVLPTVCVTVAVLFAIHGQVEL